MGQGKIKAGRRATRMKEQQSIPEPKNESFGSWLLKKTQIDEKSLFNLATSAISAGFNYAANQTINALSDEKTLFNLTTSAVSAGFTYAVNQTINTLSTESIVQHFDNISNMQQVHDIFEGESNYSKQQENIANIGTMIGAQLFLIGKQIYENYPSIKDSFITNKVEKSEIPPLKIQTSNASPSQETDLKARLNKEKTEPADPPEIADELSEQIDSTPRAN
ncbi:hypothetical protein Lsan_4205 [Legionella santicrucis]|uniref:Uncharacterized protein n=1 Tax=Legionella santicrucis TaxID=45074 RepID=A0A0W0YB48_9GAMM|nr:hypothetical protein [Legionella santicrucis]KTD53795.1 hypothetical protein Lsan_4205 [Legionella santicrucis]